MRETRPRTLRRKNLSSPDTEEETDTEDETAEEPQAASILEGVDQYALKLANGKSSGHVTVVNLYAEKDGTVEDEPG